jgi:hypothetical protein
LRKRTALRILMGLRNDRVAAALAAHGFTDDDIDEGWSLLRGLGRGKLGRLPPAAPRNDAIIDQLDAWENRWFPIADASLSRHFPVVRDGVFLNLSQTEGPEVAISVGTFVERFDTLADAKGPYGRDGIKAKALLEARGLTAEVMSEARSLIASLGKVVPASNTAISSETRVELERAEAALWGWYLEWSQVARTAITDRSLLRRLGFLSERGGSKDAEPVVPTPASPADGASVSVAAPVRA